jgi:hypothetical protein
MSPTPHFQVIRDRSGKEWVWALTSRFQNVMVNKVNHDEVNYRILRAPVAELVKGTSCAAPRSASYVSVTQTAVGNAQKPGYTSLVFPSQVCTVQGRLRGDSTLASHMIPQTSTVTAIMLYYIMNDRCSVVDFYIGLLLSS